MPLPSPQEIHDTITRQLKLGADLGFRKALTRHLSGRPKDKQHLVMFFDDVESMAEETMLALSLLRSISNNEQPMVSLVITGTLLHNEKLADPVFDSLVQDITLGYDLNPLRLEQLELFVNAAINELKLKLQMAMDATLLGEIHEQTGGLPGQILDELIKIHSGHCGSQWPPLYRKAICIKPGER